MLYFKDCTTLDEVKNLLRKLSKELHPDHNKGVDKGFAKMFKQYKEACERLKFKSGFKADANFNADAFYNLMRKFDHLQDVTVSFVGSFIWIEGDTRSQRETIKSINIEGYNPARWANKKLAWYFSPQGYTQKKKSKHDLEGLKAKYGCKSFDTNKTLRIS